MQPCLPSTPEASPRRSSRYSGFRRTHVVTADEGAMDGMPLSSFPPPRRESAREEDTRSEGSCESGNSDSETTTSSSGNDGAEHQQVQGEQPIIVTLASAANAKKHKKTKRRHHDGGDNAQPPSAPTALTTDAVNRAFGATGSENRDAGGPLSGEGGILIQPTTKEGNDAASMYSMSQSVLPVDPRDRLYYRPRRHLLQCYLKRKKDGNVLKQMLPLKSCTYHFFLEHTDDFVLAARQHTTRKSTKAEDMTDGIQGQSYDVKGFGNVVFSVNAQQLEKDPRSFVGKISRRGNSTEVVMYSEGSKQNRKEICAIRFEAMQDGQRRIKVILPAIDEETGFIRPLEGGQVKFLRDGRGTTLYGANESDNGSRLGIETAWKSSDDDEVDDDIASRAAGNAPEFKPTGEGKAAGAVGRRAKWRTHSLLVREYLRDARSPNIIVLQNKPAKWDATLRGYQLDFHGRVTKASEKNFQLVPMCQPDKVVMLFGKQGGDRFAVDFRYPLCGLQAAAVATTMVAARSL